MGKSDLPASQPKGAPAYTCYWPTEMWTGCWFGARRVPHVHEVGGPILTACAYATREAAWRAR